MAQTTLNMMTIRIQNTIWRCVPMTSPYADAYGSTTTTAQLIALIVVKLPTYNSL
ncbi:hypothetical protein U14_05127 [Candidatus Moduliflexus flocculans]|uniref:Uncharacterized protein n=1 Tax=Candidatus Moduliflexus flocculans TaxID=1499966 RepID=A0A081BR22_9BACT|nr:hypothetical protein U14_05127 [Candidatus Moduliflexus flocculans]